MDLDNINDIEVLREAAKKGRVQLKKDIDAYGSSYAFKKGLWYLVERDEYYVHIFSEDYTHTVALTYREANEYLN